MSGTGKIASVPSCAIDRRRSEHQDGGRENADQRASRHQVRNQEQRARR